MCMILKKYLTKDHYSRYGKKENQTNTKKNNQKAGCNASIQHIIINLHTNYDYPSLQNSTETFDKKFIIQSLKRKKIRQILGRISSIRLVLNRIIQHIIINLHTKYDHSSLQGSIETFDEKCIIQSLERKKIRQILGRISSIRLVLNPIIQHVIINLHAKYHHSSLQGSSETFDEKFIIQSMERKKIRQILERISRIRLVHVRKPTIQHIIINLHTKYDYSRL